jgi:hypothetical protein
VEQASVIGEDASHEGGFAATSNSDHTHDPAVTTIQNRP